jgi:hypothetical protein
MEASPLRRTSLSEMTPVGFESLDYLISINSENLINDPIEEDMSPRDQEPVLDLKLPPPSVPKGQRNIVSNLSTLFKSPKASPKRNIFFSKQELRKLQSPISKIFYVNRLKQEICLPINPSIPILFPSRTDILYSIGSLYTSIIPCLVVPGVASLILSSHSNKILMLNGSLDRETEGYTAIDFINAVKDALDYSYNSEQLKKEYYGTSNEGDVDVFVYEEPKEKRNGFPSCRYITHVIYLNKCEIDVNVKEIEDMGIMCVGVENREYGIYDIEELRETIYNITG